MKRLLFVTLTLAIFCFSANAQVRSTGLPRNYPEDGSLPAWYNGAPATPQVAYHAYTWMSMDILGDAKGEIYYDPVGPKSYSWTDNIAQEGTGNMEIYLLGDYVYLVQRGKERILKIKKDLWGGDANKMNELAGVNVVKESYDIPMEAEPCEYKGRLVVHKVTKHVDVTSIGGQLVNEENITEKWIDCETGIVLKSTQGANNSTPSETYGITIGPQPASKFVIPEGIKIVDLSAVNGLMGLQTGKTQEQNTADVNKKVEDMMSAIEKIKSAYDAAKNK